jgi:ATP adenylyltransferase
MESHSLYAPWRMPYIKSLAGKEAGGCFLCEGAQASSAEEKKRRLTLWTSEHSIVLMNRFPYTNGHLMVAPREHLAELERLSADQLLDLQRQTVAAIELLKGVMSPQGFNIGINLGRCAGAGVPGHLHQHIVPRWAGDVNFMSVIADVRVVPEAVETLYDELMAAVKG